MALSQELIDAYKRTSYTAWNRSDKIVIRVGEICTALEKILIETGAKEWAFLTAHNPQSRKQTALRNDQRQEELLRDLAEAKFEFFRGESVADSAEWPAENGALVLGITESAALGFAAKYGQAAFVYGAVGESARLVITDQSR